MVTDQITKKKGFLRILSFSHLNFMEMSFSFKSCEFVIFDYLKMCILCLFLLKMCIFIFMSLYSFNSGIYKENVTEIFIQECS